MKLAEGLYRIDGVRGANAYLAETDDGLLVIDTGMPGSAKRIVEFVRSIGHKPSDVRTIVITHADPDHTGGVAKLRELTGAAVAIHPADAPVLAGTAPGRFSEGVVGALLSVLKLFVHTEHGHPDILLQDGDVVACFEVMHTPGHTPGSITLYRDGVVFAGDALLSDSKGNERPPSKALAGDYDQALESADRIRGLHYRLLLTGHGAPVFAEPGDKPTHTQG